MPEDASWFAEQIRNLQRQITELAAARSLEAAQITGGALRVKDAQGNLVAVIGTLEDGNVAVATYRASDGTVAFQSFGDFAGFRDRNGRIVVSDDATSGTGLATPHVNGGVIMSDQNITRWPSTTNTAFTGITAGWYEVHNPRITFAVQLQADAGTTGQFRMKVNGTQVDSTQTVTGGFATWQPTHVTLPPGVTPGTTAVVSLEAMVSAGTGTVRASFLQFRGDQSP